MEIAGPFAFPPIIKPCIPKKRKGRRRRKRRSIVSSNKRLFREQGKIRRK